MITHENEEKKKKEEQECQIVEAKESLKTTLTNIDDCKTYTWRGYHCPFCNDPSEHVKKRRNQPDTNGRMDSKRKKTVFLPNCSRSSYSNRIEEGMYHSSRDILLFPCDIGRFMLNAGKEITRFKLL